MRAHAIVSFILVASVAALTSGCNRQSAVPEAQSTTGVQPRLEPITISGCLRSGLAEDTFVLTPIRSDDSTKPATYELIGSKGVNLRQYVGQQVEVSGTI